MLKYITFICLLLGFNFFSFRKNIKDPGIYFTLVYSIIFLVTPIYVSVFDSYGWYQKWIDNSEVLLVYMTTFCIGLIGLTIGNQISQKTKKFNIVHVRSLSALELMMLIIGSVFFGLEIYFTGFDLFFRGLSSDQFSYNGIEYTFRQINQLILIPLLSYSIVLYKSKKQSIFIFTLAIVYILFKILQGDRSVLFAILLPIIFARSADIKFSLKRVLIYSFFGLFTLIFLGRMRQYMAGFGASDHLYSNNGWMMLLYESINGIFISNGTLFPLISEPIIFDFEERLMLFFSPILNLIPSFLFDGARPTPIPSLLFHERYFSSITDQGFGLSVLSEGYMIGGYLGALIISGILGFSLRYAYLLSSNGAFFKWLYGWTAYNALWFLRSDSTVFVKSVLLPSLLILILIGFRKAIIKTR